MSEYEIILDSGLFIHSAVNVYFDTQKSKVESSELLKCFRHFMSEIWGIPVIAFSAH